MCGRFFVDDRDLPLIPLAEEKKKARGPLAGQLKDSGEIRPADTVSVLANGRDLAPALFAMRWGYSAGGKLLINARYETAAEKPLFREDLRRHRCVIPAAAYFEWGRADRRKYRIAAADGGSLYLAGLYRLEEKLPVFVILTREPQESIAFIHSRMPLLLQAAALRDWLDLSRQPEALPLSGSPEIVYRAAE